MIGLALRLLPVWRWLRNLFMRRPLLTACFFLALWGAWERSGRMKALDQRDQCRTASQAAADATKAMRETERKEYQEKADHAEQEHKQALNDVRAATSRYIAANRVQPPRHISAPAAVDQASDTAEPSPVPSGAFVAISDADMHVCGAAAAYAVNAHDYLMSIGN